MNRIDLQIENLTEDVKSTREDLIQKMKGFGERLIAEAGRLADVGRTPDSLGYVAVNSTANDIDRLAILLAAKMEILYKLNRAIAAEASKKA